MILYILLITNIILDWILLFQNQNLKRELSQTKRKTLAKRVQEKNNERLNFEIIKQQSREKRISEDK